jgi:hypothetical protein
MEAGALAPRLGHVCYSLLAGGAGLSSTTVGVPISTRPSRLMRLSTTTVSEVSRPM